jgi:ribosomal-protein-alanine N-acetyltransferase
MIFGGLILKVFLNRACKQDCDLMFNWANDISVRENSFNNNELNYDEHVNWFDNKLHSDNSVIFLFYYNNLPVGQVRTDIENKVGLISYSLDKNYRGRGLSIEMLRLLEANINNDVNKLIGYVKFENISSQKNFEKLGYIKSVNESFIKYYKLI